MKLEDRILKQLKEDEIVKLLQELIRIPSVNPPCRLEEIASFVAEQLRRYGLEVEIKGDKGADWQRPNVIGPLRGTGLRSPRCVISRSLAPRARSRRASTGRASTPSCRCSSTCTAAAT